MSDNQALTTIRPSLSAGGSLGALIPQNIDEAWRLSEGFAKAKIGLPRGITEPAQVMLIICGGAEVGFGPFQSLQSFALINNRLTIWGDAIPALLWSRGFKLKEWFENVDPAYPNNMVAKCIVTRPDGTEIEGEYSVSDAKEAKLWTKEGPWQTSKKRMLKMRARAFAARDGAPDVLRGIAIREEVEDYDVINEVRTEPQTLTADFSDQRQAQIEEQPKPKRAAKKAEPEAASAPAQAEANPEPQESQEEAETVDGEVLDAEVITEGHAAKDEIYLHADFPALEDGRRVTFKNGERFSTAKDQGTLKIYGEHAPEVAAPDEPEPEAEGEEAGDGLPPELGAYVNTIENAGTWVDVKKAMQAFYITDYFKGLSPEQQNQIRGSTWDVVNEATYSDKPDHAADVSAFRLWIEWIEDPDAIQGTLRVLEGEPAFAQKQDEFKGAIRNAVEVRLRALQATQS